MKKTRATKNGRSRGEDLRPEYRFDYSKSKPNRFARRLTSDVVTVVLDPDVARYCRDAKCVNDLLRAAIAAVVKPAARRSR